MNYLYALMMVVSLLFLIASPIGMLLPGGWETAATPLTSI
jgi:hypothetical protein